MPKVQPSHDVITIDTSTFRSKGYDFSNKAYQPLDELIGKPISIVMSDMVVKEVKSQLIRSGSKKIDALSGKIAKCVSGGLIPLKEAQAFKLLFSNDDHVEVITEK